MRLQRLALILIVACGDLFAQETLYDPTFDTPQTYSAGEEVDLVEDVNGDGWPEIISLTGNLTYISINNGDGTFEAADSYVVGYEARNVAISDFDGDSDLDIAVFNAGLEFAPFYAQGGYTMLWNGGGGALFPGSHQARGYTWTGGFAADFNGDRLSDLVIKRITPQASNPFVGLTLNLGNGTFSNGATSLGTFSIQDNIAAADFDLDGDIDVILTESSRTQLFMRRNDGNANFTQSVVATIPTGIVSIDALDIEGDGDMDLSLSDGTATFLINDGAGNFTPMPSSEAGESPERDLFINSDWAFVTDVNGDDRPDVFVNKRIYLNQSGDGLDPAFAPRFAFQLPVAYDRVRFADVNRDGKIDAVSSDNSGLIRVFINITPSSVRDWHRY